MLKDSLTAKEQRQLLDASERKAVAKKLSVEQFCVLFGTSYISVSIRYGSLSVTGSSVTVRFDNETGELKVSGTYGLPVDQYRCAADCW